MDRSDGGTNQKQLIKKRLPEKAEDGNSKSNISDEEGRETINTDQTIRKIIPSKQPMLNNRKSGKQSSSKTTNEGTLSLSEHPTNPILISSHAMGPEGSKLPGTTENKKSKKTTDKGSYETIPSVDEHPTQVTTFYALPSDDTTTNPTKLSSLRSISYHQAHHRTPPFVYSRTHISLHSHHRSNTNDDSSHCSEITIDTTQSSVSNPSYSKLPLREIPSSHSNKQQINQSKQEDETDAETGDEDKKEESHLLKSQPTSHPAERTTNQAVANLNEREENAAADAAEAQRIKRRKRLRFRWYLLYTMIKNYQLFDLRKDADYRLARLYLHRSNLMDEQQFTAVTPMEEPGTIEGAAQLEDSPVYPQGM